MLSPLQLVWVVAAPLLLGALAQRALGLPVARDRLAFCGRSWPIGCLLLAATTLALLLAGVPSSLWPIAPLLPAVPMALAVRRRGSLPALAAAIAPTVPQPRWFVGFVLLGSAVPLFFLVTAQLTPCLAADEANLWAMKAKSLYLEWPRGEFGAAQASSEHADYPLLNPLLQAWVYAQHGEVVHFHNRLPIQLCTLSLWLVLCAALRRLVPAWLAVLLASPVLIDAEFASAASTAYSDAMVALGLVVAFDGWLCQREQPSRGHRALAGIGLAFALWSKNEALLHIVALAGGAAAWGLLQRRVVRRPDPWLLLPAAIVCGQLVWNRWYGLVSDYLGAPPSPGVPLPQLFVRQFAHHGPIVLRAALDALFSCQSMSGLLLPPIAALPLAWPLCRSCAALFVPAVGFALSFVGLHLVYVGTWLPIDMHLRTSQVRVLCQLAPAAALWLAAAVRRARQNAG